LGDVAIGFARGCTLGKAEKVRSQFFSLRQITGGGVFSARSLWQLSPASRLNFDLSFELLTGKFVPSLSKGPLFSEPQDVGGWYGSRKSNCFELLWPSAERGWESSFRWARAFDFRMDNRRPVKSVMELIEARNLGLT
jgi:hypothetical protein